MDNYETDKWISDLFTDYYDPCPFNPIWTDGIDLNGLESEFCEENCEGKK